MATLALKWISKCDHLIENTTKAPDIRFLIVFFSLEYLGSHDEGSSYFCFCHIESLVHELRDTKISNFKLLISSDEDVVGFDIPVNNLFIVHIFES